MENNEPVVETTENVEEQATEELVDGAKVTTEPVETEEEKLYSQKDLDKLVNEKIDALLPKKLERAKSKLERDYEEKYSRVETVLNAGLGTQDLEEATNKLASFYEQKGIKIPTQPRYKEKDIEVLANAEANEIISLGYDEIVSEVDRLAEIGIDNMNQRDKLIFTRIAAERQKLEDKKSLSSIGVSDDFLNDADFKEFSDKLNPSLSLKEKYELYNQFKPKPKVEPIGSMKSDNKPVKKDYYTPEELSRLTAEDLNDPEIMKVAEYSMQEHYKQAHRR